MKRMRQPACLALYSSVAERQSCKLKVLGSITSGGSLVTTDCPAAMVALRTSSNAHCSRAQARSMGARELAPGRVEAPFAFVGVRPQKGVNVLYHI